MIGVVEAHGATIALAEIRSVQHVQAAPRSAEHYRLHHRQGCAPVEMMPFDYADLLARPVQLIPAEPGTRLVTVFGLRDGEPPLADVMPILSWALCFDGQVRPVLPSGVRRGYSPASTLDWHPDYVQLPNGSMYELGLEADWDRYDSIEGVIAREVGRAQRYEADRQERAAAKTERQQ